MATTYTAVGYYATPRLPVGVSLQTFTFTYNGRTADADDVIFLGRLAARAIVLDVRAQGFSGTDQSPVSSTASGLSAKTTWHIGTPAEADFFNGAAITLTVSAARSLQTATGYPKTLSVSGDLLGPQYVTLQAKRLTGSVTQTASIRISVLVQSPDV